MNRQAKDHVGARVAAGDVAAHIDLGNAHHGQGRFDQAIDCYLRAIELQPDHMDAHNNLCAVLLAQGKFDAVAEHYRHILAVRPDYAPGYRNLAVALLGAGDAPGALDAARHALTIAETSENKLLFVRCLQAMKLSPAPADMRNLVARAMSEPWGRPGALTRACINLIKTDPEIAGCIARAVAAWPARLPAAQVLGPSGLHALSSDPLLRCLLENARSNDIALEQCLTNVRRAVLEAASVACADDAPDGDILGFCCALARQCFINEYVFAHTDDEYRLFESLRERLTAALRAHAPVPVLWPVAVAAYMPLHRLPGRDALLGRSWPGSVNALLVQQVHEPAEEMRLRDTIPQLTAIDDDVSLLVQSQYEENPYPKWVRAAPAPKPVAIDTRLRAQFPLATFRNLGKTGRIDVLVAGCGTGQQLLDVAQRIAGARVLAIDLSLASLGYAKRQMQALGIGNIEFGRADILKLGVLGRTFDVIDCGGVLHHLGDPLAGWRVLLSLLRPDGVMRVALYSELARQHIVAARAFVAQRGYPHTPDGIRQFRQDVLALPDCDPVKAVALSPDFFSVGDCRDLVFHVQEHRFTLPRIKEFLDKCNLEFIGFDINAHVLGRYRACFPEDRACTDLDRWHAFEQKERTTFGRMYQFWLQKR